MSFNYAIPTTQFCTDGQVLGQIYKLFYNLVKKENKSAVEALEILGITRSCCRSKLLCLSRYIMIDSAHDAFIDETTGIEKGFPDILPKVKINIIGIE